MIDYLIQFGLLRERAFHEPNNRKLFRKLLICTELTGNYEAGRELYLALLDEHPYCSYAWYNLGWACVQLNRSDDALEAFEYAYITQPYFEEAYRACAELAVQQGLHRQALQCYAELNMHTEADSEVLVRMGECYRVLGDLPQAKKLCRRALQLTPCHAEASYQLGACYSATSEYQEAAKWLRRAIRTEDRHAEYHSALALAYGYLGKPHKALHHLWRAVELAPDEAVFWLQLAEFLLFAGELQEAKEVLEQALENTSSVELLYCTAACQFLTGERQTAVDTLLEALHADVSRHPDIFRWAPALREDAEVLGLLSTYR